MASSATGYSPHGMEGLDCGGPLVIASVILDDQEVEALRLPTDPQSVPQLGPTTSPKSAASWGPDFRHMSL